MSLQDPDEILGQSSKVAGKSGAVPDATLARIRARQKERYQPRSRPAPSFPPTRCRSAEDTAPPGDLRCSTRAMPPGTRLPLDSFEAVAGHVDPPATPANRCLILFLHALHKSFP